MSRLTRLASVLLSACALFVAGALITVDLMWRALTGKEGL